MTWRRDRLSESTTMARARDGPPIDGGWGWIVVIASGLSGFCMVGIAKSFGIIADELKVYFGVPQYMVAMVFAVSAILYTFAAPISMILGERFTQRKTVMFAGVIGCLGMALSSLCVDIIYVICTFGICFGIGNGFLYGNTLVMVGKYFKKRRSLASGLTLAGSSVGQFALPPLIQYFINTYTVKGALLLLGGIYFHVTFFGALLRPLSSYRPQKNAKDVELANGEVGENRTLDLTVTIEPSACAKGVNREDLCCGEVKSVEKENSADNSDCEKLQSTSLLELPINDADTPNGLSKPCCTSGCTIPKFLDFSVLKNRKCLLYSFVMFFMFFGYFNFIIFLPSIAFTRGIVEYQKAALVSVGGVSDLVARILCGFVSDLNIVQRYKIMSVCSVLVGVNILLFAWSQTFWQMAVQSGAYGFFGGGYIMLVPLVLIDFVGLDLLPRALAPVLFLQGSGAAVGQVFLGWIRDITGDFTAVLMVCGICNLIGGLSILLYPLVKKWEEERISEKNKDLANHPPSDKEATSTNQIVS
ncbi:monocarboxylate transporter 12-like [Liolophura sinensis]|uniref:monocarboxylate transporter 12-like n=1 Tax=Liolophura sinensis TaxID=3198878 RepID=UPI003158669E